MKTSMAMLCLSLGLVGGEGHAARSCLLMIPQDCEVVNSNYSATSTDGTHVVQVDCRRPNGELTKYLTTRFAVSSMFGMGRDYLPRQITFRAWPRDEIRITCQ